MVFWLRKTEADIRGSGRKIREMEKANRCYTMVIHSGELSKTMKSTVTSRSSKSTDSTTVEAV